MKAKSICLIIFCMITFAAFSQQLPFDTTGKGSTIPPPGADTIKWTSIIQHKSSDTVNNTGSKKPEIKKPLVKTDKRWFISPFLKFQAQDFGMIEKQKQSYLSNAETLPFTNKSNRSIAASVYKNLNGHFSASLDLGASIGHVTSKALLISTTRSKTYGLGTATLYYNLLGNQFKLQPFLAAGINGLVNKASYISAPVGAGIKYSGKKIMIEGQGAYGYAISKNIAGTLMYSLGIYIPFRTKKQKEKDAEEARKKDTGTVKVTNVINNYYFYNKDSLKNAQDSMLADIEKKKNEVQDEEESDPDDPMHLNKAVKHTVYFYYDQYALTSNGFATIDQIIQKLKDNPKLFVHLKGHTDQSGSEQYNAPLSKKRSQMVFDYMNSRGVSAERMILSSYGKKKPAVQNEDPNTAWMNRRCEMVLFEK